MAVGNLAYHYPDPVANALGQLNESLRGASGDVLKRRQLDLAAQQLEAQTAHQAQLAGLQEKTITGQSAAELAKVTGNLALLERQEGRAGEAHGLQMETGRFQLQRGQELLPLEKGKIAADIRQSEQQGAASMLSARASAANAATHARSAAVVDRLNSLKVEELTQQLAFQQTPVEPGQVLAMAQALVGKEGGAALMAAGPPPTTMGGLLQSLEIASKIGSPTVQQFMLDKATEAYQRLPEGSPEHAAAAEDLAQRRMNLGLTKAGQAPKPDEVILGMAVDAHTALTTYLSRPPEDLKPDVVKLLARNLDEAEARTSYISDPTRQAQAMALRPRQDDAMFRGIAQELVTREVTMQGADPEKIEAWVQQKAHQLVLDHGTPQAYRAWIQSQGAVLPGATPGPLAGAAPPSQAPAFIPRNRQGPPTAAQRTEQATQATTQATAQVQATAPQEFDRMALEPRLYGFAQVPQAQWPALKEVYVQMRVSQPTTPIRVILEQFKAQLQGAAR